MIADAAREQDGVSRPRPLRGDLNAVRQDTDPARVDEDLVAGALPHDLRVPRYDAHAGGAGRFAHRQDDAVQVLDGKPLLADEAHGDVKGPCAAHREVVDGAVNGERADVAARKEERRDHVRVRRERQPRALDVDHSLVVEAVEDRVAEGGQEQSFDELRRQHAPAAVAEQDLLVIQDRQRTGSERHFRGHPPPPWRRGLGPTAGEAGSCGIPGSGGC